MTNITVPNFEFMSKRQRLQLKYNQVNCKNKATHK